MSRLCDECWEPLRNRAPERTKYHRSCYLKMVKRDKLSYRPALVGWAYHHEKCVRCEGIDSPHKSRGVCSRCWMLERMRRKKGTYGKSCVICAETRSIDRCHILPKRLDGNEEPWNTLYLCATHHRCFDQDELHDDEWVKIKRKVSLAIQRVGWTSNGKFGQRGSPQVFKRLA